MMANPRRVVADRLVRVWRICEHIAEHPGDTRLDLAKRFVISERQMQGDLNIIRVDMGLPLVRRQGYHFAAESGIVAGPNSLTLHDGLALMLMVRHAIRGRVLPRESIDALVSKLPHQFPPHLAPLLGRTLDAVVGSADLHQHVLIAVTEAMARQQTIKLHYGADYYNLTTIREPVVTPVVVLPFLGSWYVLGHCEQQKRVNGFDIAGVYSVSSVQIERTTRAVTSTRYHESAFVPMVAAAVGG